MSLDTLPATLAAAPPPLRWPAIDPFADAVNPALGVLLFGLAVVAWRAGRTREAVGLPITLLVLLGVAYGLAYFDRVLGVFALFGLDFSTHGAVHLAAWAALLVWHPARWPWALAVTLAYHALMALQGYHTAFDLLATAAVVGLPLTVLGTALRPAARRRADSAPPGHNAGS
ncbi:hypothetical protein [Silanimonas sp.]|jgi:hypothetical protein|uniref:hypothetical protein n=1 Tax=Silanimonas sp. TaxID=1929290 RepID=UPI0037C593F7